MMCRSSVIFRTVPDIDQCKRLRTNNSDAPGLPCISLINMIEQHRYEQGFVPYDAHFAVECYKTGCTYLDAFHVLTYALVLAPAPKPLI